MENFRRDRGSRSRSSRSDRGDSDREGGRSFGRSTSRFGSRGSGRGFGGRSSDRGFDRGRGKSRADYEMHKVTCDKCGKECEVPFKPTSSKPVYCSDCFKNPETPRRGAERSESRPSASKADLDIINEKLNKIMKALNIE